MKANPKDLTYPEYAEHLFEMAGAMIGETRTQPPNRADIQK